MNKIYKIIYTVQYILIYVILINFFLLRSGGQEIYSFIYATLTILGIILFREIMKTNPLDSWITSLHQNSNHESQPIVRLLNILDVVSLYKERIEISMFFGLYKTNIEIKKISNILVHHKGITIFTPTRSINIVIWVPGSKRHQKAKKIVKYIRSNNTEMEKKNSRPKENKRLDAAMATIITIIMIYIYITTK